MASGYTGRSVLEFQRTFATENVCAEHLKTLWWPEGFACPRCAHTAAWYPGTLTYNQLTKKDAVNRSL
jgi:hypothetical protein